MNTHSHFTLLLSKRIDNNVFDNFKIPPPFFHFVIYMKLQCKAPNMIILLSLKIVQSSYDGFLLFGKPSIFEQNHSYSVFKKYRRIQSIWKVCVTGNLIKPRLEFNSIRYPT